VPARPSWADRVRRLREITALLPPEALAAQRRLRRRLPRQLSVTRGL
jgi:hypothetical protein